MTRPVIALTGTVLAEEAKALLAAAGASVHYIGNLPLSEATLIEAMSRPGVNAILLRGSPPITRRVLEAAKGLKIIAKHGAGIDSVDIAAATELGIVIVNAGSTNADAVAEHALAMMLSLARDLPMHDRKLRSGLWDKVNYEGREFRGRLVGIVGFGAIGRRTANLCAALGARVVVHSRTRLADTGGYEQETDFEALLKRVDILSLHCPLTGKNRGMMGAKQFALMKPDAMLVNTGRGGLVDEPALHEALTTGKIACAGLEVFAKEPTDPDNPLLRLPNVLSSPHVSAITRETLNRLGVVTAGQIIDFLRDGTLDRTKLINPQVLG